MSGDWGVIKKKIIIKKSIFSCKIYFHLDSDAEEGSGRG